MTGDLINDYFEWLYSKIDDGDQNRTYRKLCMYLFDKDFYYSIPMDDNRYADGISVRYRFGDECDIPGYLITNEIDVKPCSVFEMMVALSLRMEEDMAYEERYGNRTPFWFHGMLHSLGLSDDYDGRFNKDRAEHIVDMFLERLYSKDGRGGLFTITNMPDTDMRDVEIWCQANWYLIELWKGERKR